MKKLPPCFAFKNSGKHPRKDEIKKRFNELHERNQFSFSYKGFYGYDRKQCWYEDLIDGFPGDVVKITEDDFLAMTEPEKKVEPEIVTEPELPYKGDIKDFPKEVVEWMLDNQVKQGNKRDISVFEESRFANKINGGFDWGIVDSNFCCDVIYKKNFDLFFEKYPNYTSTKKTLTGQIIEISERGILIELTQEQIKEFKIFETVTIKR
jgi:hypothetical protein